MPYFLSSQNLGINQEAEITGEEAGHILLSHRVKKGEKLKLQDPTGKRFVSEVVSANKKSLHIKVLEFLPVPPEPKVSVTLFQSVVSEKALDFIFQKGTELGLNKILLFNSANTATKLTQELFQKKQQRWNKILIEAAKQSERAKWPALEFVGGLDAAIDQAKKLDIIYLTDISGQKGLQISKTSESLGLIVGPEGGFTEEEIVKFKHLPNLQTASLGPILLRADTAALASLAIIRNFI